MHTTPYAGITRSSVSDTPKNKLFGSKMHKYYGRTHCVASPHDIFLPKHSNNES